MRPSAAPILPARLALRLAGAQSVLVLTGAGMSAESGIPTFRDAQTGLWKRFRPEELATPQAFDANPERVWSWYEWRRERVRGARPHAGYHALVDLESLVPSLYIATQNVDGLHQAAGSRNVIELHGNIMRSVCSRTRRPIDETWLRGARGMPPPSPHAPGAFARPDVVWFGEALPPGALEKAWALASAADALLSIGTSTLVQPAASLPWVALQAGALVLEINPEPTSLSPDAHHCIELPAGQALPLLVAQVRTAGTRSDARA